jgi:thiol-disulfide isomerase/thioredoxin
MSVLASKSRSILLASLIVATSIAPPMASPVFAGDVTAPESLLRVAEAGGTAPEFSGLRTWFNSGPLRMADLRGKVVLVDFWTYGCVNCVRTLPHMVRLQEKYRDKGLVIVGIHTPEFPFEKSAGNVQAALKRHGITYAVAQDNESQTWNAYSNRYWPAQYIVDQSGKIVFQHDGEGQYEQIDRTIAQLLSKSG